MKKYKIHNHQQLSYFLQDSATIQHTVKTGKCSISQAVKFKQTKFSPTATHFYVQKGKFPSKCQFSFKSQSSPGVSFPNPTFLPSVSKLQKQKSNCDALPQNNE